MTVKRVATIAFLTTVSFTLFAFAAVELRLNHFGDARYQRRTYMAEDVAYCRSVSDPKNAAELRSTNRQRESYVHCMKWDLNANGDDKLAVDLTKPTVLGKH